MGVLAFVPIRNQRRFMESSNKELKLLLKSHETFSITPINQEFNLVNYRAEPSEEICRATGEKYLEHLFNNAAN